MLYVTAFLIILFSGFRFNAGFDYINYYNMLLGNMPYDNMELFSRWLMNFSRSIEEPQVFFILTSIIYVIFTIIALEELYVFGWISLFLFCFLFLSYFQSFDLIRQFMAISICFLAVAESYKNNNMKAFFGVFIAFLFHGSALIIVPLILFKKLLLYRYKNIIYILSLISLYASSKFVVPVVALFSGKYSYYFVDQVSSGGRKVYVLFALFVINLFVFDTLLRTRKNSDVEDYHEELSSFSLNLGCLGLALYTLMLDYGTHLVRISYYFIPWLYVSSQAIYYRCADRDRVIYLPVIVAFGVISFLGIMYMSMIHPTRNYLLDYQFFWESKIFPVD